MSKILKIEAFAGMSGDMFLGALCGLANAYEVIKKLPVMLHLDKEVRIDVTDVVKNGIACKHVKVVDLLKNDSHSHQHTHDHLHPHKHSHSHPHRHLKDINHLIDHGDISERAKSIAKNVFLKLGEAESSVHGIPLEKIHFHEVGAIDSIMDIVGSAWLLDILDVEKVYCTHVTTGFGFAMTEHGKLPIPCPATQILLHGVPTIAGEERGEMTTPTGAAILKHLNPDFSVPVLKELKTSYGPGEKDFIIPNTLRISICEPVEKSETPQVVVIQTNIDDFSGEYLGTEFQENLIKTGALDVYIEQVIMKKGRPGIVLNVLCSEKELKQVSDFIVENTSTIGLRYFFAKRLELYRKNSEINTSMGKVSVKESLTPGGNRKIKVESKDILKIAKELNKNPLEINQLILNEYNYEKDQ